MQFISILRKSHVTNKYAITHLWVTIPIIKEEEVLTINAESFFRKLCPESTALPHNQLLGRLPFLPGVREEGNGKAAVWQLRQLLCPLQCAYACHRRFHARNYRFPPPSERTSPGGCHISWQMCFFAPQTAFSAGRGEFRLSLFLIFVFKMSFGW